MLKSLSFTPFCPGDPRIKRSNSEKRLAKWYNCRTSWIYRSTGPSYASAFLQLKAYAESHFSSLIDSGLSSTTGELSKCVAYSLLHCSESLFSTGFSGVLSNRCEHKDECASNNLLP